MEIKNVEDISRLLVSGFTNWKEHGEVYTKEKGDLVLFNYLPTAQFKDEWTFLETVSRGLIVNRKTGEIVARPFDKFFNYGERGRYSTAPIVSVAEKMDGTLGILYRVNGQYKIATRGAFDSEQAIWATRWISDRNMFDDLENYFPHASTLLFEIIYSGNRIVIDYDFNGLVLLAVRNRFTGEYYPQWQVTQWACEYGFRLPRLYHHLDSVTQLTDICQNLGENEEGYVVEFADGQRFKFKGAKYLQLHKIISGFKWENVFEAVKAGTFDTYIELLPDEFTQQAKIWKRQIVNLHNQYSLTALEVYKNAPKETKKDFALYVNKHDNWIAGICFAMYDKKPFQHLIWKAVEKKHEFEVNFKKSLKGAFNGETHPIETLWD